jgi:hypothetical protein
MEPLTADNAARWLAEHLSDVVVALAQAGAELEPKPVNWSTVQHDSPSEDVEQ